MNLSSGKTVTWKEFYFGSILNDRGLDFIIIILLFFIFVFNLHGYKISHKESGINLLWANAFIGLHFGSTNLSKFLKFNY